MTCHYARTEVDHQTGIGAEEDVASLRSALGIWLASEERMGGEPEFEGRMREGKED